MRNPVVRLIHSSPRVLQQLWRLWLACGCSLVVAAAEPAAVEAAPTGSIRVLSYNIMWEEKGVRAGNQALPVWKERRNLVRDIIRRYQPDLIGLQEASPEQQVDLAEDNPDYGIVYDRNMNNTNPVMYRTQRFTAKDSGAFVLNDVPERPGTNIGVRKASFVRLIDAQTGNAFTVFNIHLDSRGNGSTRRIGTVRLVEKMAAEQDPVLLTGDFNCRETSPTMRFLFGQQSLTDNRGAPFENPRPLSDALELINTGYDLIDHVLVDRRVEVLAASQLRDVDRNASDHFAVLAVVSLRRWCVRFRGARGAGRRTRTLCAAGRLSPTVPARGSRHRRAGGW
jgi:endonuclease/exonuclease/phosphatase family metal-dependent hydrolase